MIKGTLRIKPTKKGKEFKAIYTNAKGKDVEFPIMAGAMHFESAKAVDGDPVELECAQNGGIIRCTIPGKEAKPAPSKPPVRPAHSQTGRPGQGHASHGPAPTDPPLTNATAPYNFITYEPSALLPHTESDESPDQRWSGVLRCSLEALTPLLVAGPQIREEGRPARKTFFTVNGGYVIPGSSIKGILRSLVEVLSFSNMRPMNAKNIFWRNISSTNYRDQFLGAGETILGGYLIKRGAKYRLVRAEVQAVLLNTPATEGKELVRSGEMNGKKHDYIFSRLHEAEREVQDDVADDFMNQRTPAQITRWDQGGYEQRIQNDGIPVFYRKDSEGQITALGLCRYFRLKYARTPAEFAPDNGLDFARTLFGTTSDQGRVAVGAAVVTGEPDQEYTTVLGQPHPTCLAHYLEQKAVERSTKGNRGNKLETFSSYDALCRLRGRKWYWHRDVDVPQPPNANVNVQSTLCPVQAGATATFEIRVDRVTSLELGALFEALELFDGHAHKLGLGKPLGFGSVRISLDQADVRRVGERYASLGARLDRTTSEGLAGATRDGLSAAFRAEMLRRIVEKYPTWKNIQDYENLPPIKTLRIMMDFENRPANHTTRYMTLDEFKLRPLLRTPEQIRP